MRTFEQRRADAIKQLEDRMTESLDILERADLKIRPHLSEEEAWCVYSDNPEVNGDMKKGISSRLITQDEINAARTFILSYQMLEKIKNNPDVEPALLKLTWA